MEYSISQDIVSGSLDAGKLQSEILAGNCIQDFKGLLVTGDNIEVMAIVTDQSALDAIVHNHVAVSLDDKKSARIIEIDTHTDEIIANGFSFDSNMFSLSIQAQMNWSALFSMQSLMTFPIGVTTLDNTTYSLAYGNLIPFIVAGMTVIKTAVGSGRNLKVAVNAATNQSELDAVVDSR